VRCADPVPPDPDVGAEAFGLEGVVVVSGEVVVVDVDLGGRDAARAGRAARTDAVEQAAKFTWEKTDRASELRKSAGV